MKKQFFSIILSLFMVMLFPVTVFAENTDNPMIKINAPDEICPNQDCIFTVTVSGAVEDILFQYEAENKGEGGLSLSQENGELKGIVYKGWGKDDHFVLTVYGKANGVPISTSKTIKINHIFVDGVCECGVMQLTVPFTTTINLGGNVAPGKTTFELEAEEIDENVREEDYKDVTVSAGITTNGAGSYNGTMTFTGTYNQLMAMLSSGVFVKQVNAGEENWTYDDTVWGVVMKGFAELSADTLEYSISIFSTGFEETEDGKYYYLDSDAGPVEKMAFTNTYTKSITETTKPTESTKNNTNGGKTKSPQTGDNSNLTLWLTLLVVSATGMISTCVYNKRKKSSRA